VVNPNSGQQEAVIRLGAFVTGWAENDAQLWASVAGLTSAELAVIDTERYTVTNRYPMEYTSWTPLVTDEAIWLGGAFKGGSVTASKPLFGDASGNLIRLHPVTLEVQVEKQYDTAISRPILAGDWLWFTQSDSLPLVTSIAPPGQHTLTAVDPVTLEEIENFQPCGEMLPPLPIGELLWVICRGVVETPGHVWVINLQSPKPEVLYRYQNLGREAWVPTLIEGRLWVVYAGSSNAAVFDTTTGKLLRVYGLQDAPSPPVPDALDGVWLANLGSATYQYIALHSLYQAYEN
jgi:hypothetical protein